MILHLKVLISYSANKYKFSELKIERKMSKKSCQSLHLKNFQNHILLYSGLISNI